MSLPYDESDSRSIEQYAKLLVGKTLRSSLDRTTFNKLMRDIQTRLENGKYIRDGSDNLYIVDNIRTKGDMGQLLEKYYFKYEPNSRSEPDFPKAGLELKSTPVKKVKGDILRAKERLVLNIIDYMTEHSKKWEDSSFWRKNHSLLLIFYLYQEGVPVLDLFFELIGIWEYPPEDLRIIKNDWETIVKKIRYGQAHELSEADTMYLGACVKGSGHEQNMRRQPFSDLPAKQRAFSLKQRYLNTIIDLWTGGLSDRETQPIVKSVEDYDGDETFEGLVLRRFRPYIYRTIQDIHRSLGLDIDPTSKNYFATVTLRILGVVAKKAEEFEKADIIIRTVRLKRNGMPKEAISFPYFKYKEIINEQWETSTLRALLEKRFFFVIYKYAADSTLVLRKVMFWNMPYEHREIEVKRVWERTVDLIRSGKADFLPRMAESSICHVRPHARNLEDTNETPDGRWMVNKSFWLNASYIKEQLTKDILD